MATQTTNLSLIKPGLTDKIRIAQINQNMDTIDAAVGAVGNTSLQSQVTTLSGKVNTRFTDSLFLRTTSGDATYDIQANTDLNDIQEPGTYTFLSSAVSQTLGHYPCKTNGNGKVIVNRNSGSTQDVNGWWGQQIIVRGEEIWLRVRSGTTWGEWRPVNPIADSRQAISNEGITYESGMEPTAQYSGMYIYQHTVELVFYDYKSTPSTYTNNKLIGTVASSYRCTRGFYAPVFEDETGAVVGSVYISPTGTVKYYGSTINVKCVFHAMWMIA